MMQILRYKVEFLTPAFLGDASQSGRWRTPPFKALLRQFWRMAYFEDVGAANWQLASMRVAEARLFGTAADGEGTSNRSLLRLRLSSWQKGSLNSWNGLEYTKVFHPEAEKVRFQVGPQAYLGYGPLDGRGGTKLGEKCNAAIGTQESAVFQLACPSADSILIRRAMTLMQRFGTLGGRSRNGWGSLHLEALDEASKLELIVPPISVEWQSALKTDWAHALGHDDHGALEWECTSQRNWQEAMTVAAKVKIGLRCQFLFTTGQTMSAAARDWLSYPVTNHKVTAWESGARLADGQKLLQSLRLPNSLRFKLRRYGPADFRVAVFHFPCLPPKAFQPNPTEIKAVFASVHNLLGTLTRPADSRKYLCIKDNERREKLKPQLNEVHLARVKS